MVAFEKTIDAIKGCCVEELLTTFAADFSFDVFDDVEFAVQPVLLLDLFDGGFSTAKLTSHALHPGHIR